MSWAHAAPGMAKQAAMLAQALTPPTPQRLAGARGRNPQLAGPVISGHTGSTGCRMIVRSFSGALRRGSPR